MAKLSQTFNTNPQTPKYTSISNVITSENAKNLSFFTLARRICTNKQNVRQTRQEKLRATLYRGGGGILKH